MLTTERHALNTQVFDQVPYAKRMTEKEVRAAIYAASFPSGHWFSRAAPADSKWERHEIRHDSDDLLTMNRKRRKEHVDAYLKDLLTKRWLIDNHDGTYSRVPPSPTKMVFMFRGEMHECPQSEYKTYLAELRATHPTAEQVTRRKVLELERRLAELKSS